MKGKVKKSMVHIGGSKGILKASWLKHQVNSKSHEYNLLAKARRILV